MDRRDGKEAEKQKQVYGPSAEAAGSGESSFVMEDGKRYRVPYKIIKKVTFKNLSQVELKDIPYSARLQYRLLLFDAVIKAKVDFYKKFIRIIYNNPEADNIKEKISRQKLIEFLKAEGITVSEDPSNMEETDYDYYKELYSYAYFPPSIREAPPYGWTKEEWKKEKERKAKEKYKKEHPSALDKFIMRLTGGNKEQAKKTGLTLHP